MTELAIEKRSPSPAELLQVALEKESNVEIIERVVALMERERDYQARVSFDDSLRACEEEVVRVIPNKDREKGIKWASYTVLDDAIRPLYTKHGFSLSFSQCPASGPGRMAVTATLARSGILRNYQREVPVVVPGNTSLADAEEAAYSRAQRYLVARIFNITVGIDAAEMKPYETAGEGRVDANKMADALAKMDEATTKEELSTYYFAALKIATAADDHSASNAASNKRNVIWKARGFRA